MECPFEALAGIGASLFGQRPIVEVSFGEFLPCAMNQLALQAPNLRFMTAGAAKAPVVIRTRVGDGPYRGHPQSYEAWFAHLPGLKVVMPATPADAKGLIKAAIRDDGPVLVFEHMFLYHGVRDEVPAVAMVQALPAVKQPRGRPRRRPRQLIGDRGYGFPWIIAAVVLLGIVSLLCPRGSPHGSGLGRRRYVIERTMSWLGNFRRLKLCYERTGAHFQAFHELAACLICAGKLAGSE